MNDVEQKLKDMTRELCLKMEHEHDSIFFNQSDFNYILYALLQVRNETLEAIIKKAEAIDPLEATGDFWDGGTDDEIAYGVHRYIVRQLKEKVK